MLVTGHREKPATSTSFRISEPEWSILGLVGASFIVLGAMDLVLVWYPQAFGTPEWEFSTVTATFNGLPVPVLGMTMLLASGVARRRPIITRGAAILLWTLALIVLAAFILYATTVPMAISRINNPVVRTGLLKAIAKTSVQGVMYPIVFAWAGFKGWRAVRTPRAV
jgi:hypothetical protein